MVKNKKAKNILDGQHHVVVGHKILPRSCKNGARSKAMENCVLQTVARERNIEEKKTYVKVIQAYSSI